MRQNTERKVSSLLISIKKMYSSLCISSFSIWKTSLCIVTSEIENNDK